MTSISLIGYLAKLLTSQLGRRTHVGHPSLPVVDSQPGAHLISGQGVVGSKSGRTRWL